jgi:hypothetical protein
MRGTSWGSERERESEDSIDISPEPKRFSNKGRGTRPTTRGMKRGIKRQSERHSDRQGNTPSSNPNMAEAAVNELLKRMDEIKESNARIETKIAEMDGRLKQIELLKVAVTRLEKEVKEMKGLSRSMKLNEIEGKKFWLVIKGLKNHTEMTTYETRAQTKNVLDNLFGYLGVDLVLADYFRMQAPKRPQRVQGAQGAQGRPPSTGIVKVKLMTIDDRLNIFSRVATLGRNQELKHVTFQDDLPAFQVESFKKLDKAAYDLRKSEGVRTRIQTRGTELILQKREKTEDSRWVNVIVGED